VNRKVNRKVKRNSQTLLRSLVKTWSKANTLGKLIALIKDTALTLSIIFGSMYSSISSIGRRFFLNSPEVDLSFSSWEISDLLADLSFELNSLSE